MATRNIVPRANGEGGLGTATKNWNEVRAKHFYKNGVELYSSGAYSTTEQRIGTWIDGTPLYQKTIIIQNVNISGTDLTIVDTTSIGEISGLNEIIEMACTVKIIGQSEYLGNTGYCKASVDVEFNKDISIKQAWSLKDQLCDAYITIKYTKTTD